MPCNVDEAAHRSGEVHRIEGVSQASAGHGELRFDTPRRGAASGRRRVCLGEPREVLHGRSRDVAERVIEHVAGALAALERATFELLAESTCSRGIRAPQRESSGHEPRTCGRAGLAEDLVDDRISLFEGPGRSGDERSVQARLEQCRIEGARTLERGARRARSRQPRRRCGLGGRAPERTPASPGRRALGPSPHRRGRRARDARWRAPTRPRRACP